MKVKATAQKKKVLQLGHSRFRYFGVTQVEIGELLELERLLLAATQITDTGLKEVAKLQQLVCLHLGTAEITDAGLKEVAKIKQLKTLFLGGRTSVTEVGVAQLQKALPKCKILDP